MARQVDGISLGLIAAGGLLGYAGIRGVSIPHAIQALVQGKPPGTGGTANPITGGAFVSQGGGVSSATGSAIANDALQYQGAGYVWAGVPANGIGQWDCSSFANWVVGHDQRLAIPGYAAGSYDGRTHGPNTIMWLAWIGCVTVGHSGADAEAGDLCIWQTHMGIAIGGGRMISAQQTSTGTQVSGIDGFIPGEALFIRRLKATGGTTGGGGRKK